GRLEIGADVRAGIVSLLMEAETSGGLLFSVRPERVAGVRESFRAAGEDVWEIGDVVTAAVLRLRGQRASFSSRADLMKATRRRFDSNGIRASGRGRGSSNV